MSWGSLSKLIRCCAVLYSFATFCVQAQNIETIMAPGKLIQAHAKVEEDCKQCHVRFDRKAQDGLCMACHKDVGADVRGKSGFHGRLADNSCRACHTDHKGREQNIAAFENQNLTTAKLTSHSRDVMASWSAANATKVAKNTEMLHWSVRPVTKKTISTKAH